MYREIDSYLFVFDTTIGLWINQVRSQDGEERCLVTSIGSSNYGRRSAERDLECNLFIILEPDKPEQQHLLESQSGQALSRQLVDELASLKAYVNVEDQENVHVGIFVKFFTRLIRNML
jgi:phosphatidylserine/phosphatidylglycerophosphate/cardiolipin synthase-like enzyme